MGWIENMDWKDVGTPVEGDVVHLKHEDEFCHLVKLLTQSTKEGCITGVVGSVFDWDNKAQVRAGEIVNLVGKQIEVPKKFVHELIKREPAE